MFRKSILALAAIAALSAAALVPTAAEAKKGKHIGKHYHGLHLGYVRYDDCYQWRLVETRRGLRWRMVDICW
jgi:hypothetical protein